MQRQRLLVALLLLFLELLSEISADAINKMIPKQSPAKPPRDWHRTAIALNKSDILRRAQKEKSTIVEDILTAPVNLAPVISLNWDKTNHITAVDVNKADPPFVQNVARQQTAGRLTETGHGTWTTSVELRMNDFVFKCSVSTERGIYTVLVPMQLTHGGGKVMHTEITTTTD